MPVFLPVEGAWRQARVRSSDDGLHVRQILQTHCLWYSFSGSYQQLDASGLALNSCVDWAHWWYYSLGQAIQPFSPREAERHSRHYQPSGWSEMTNGRAAVRHEHCAFLSGGGVTWQINILDDVVLLGMGETTVTWKVTEHLSADGLWKTHFAYFSPGRKEVMLFFQTCGL